MPTEFKRAQLRFLSFRGKTDSKMGLRTAIETALREAADATRHGRFLQSTSGNGHNVSFLIPTEGVTPQDALELCEELLTRYDAAVTALAGHTPAVTNPSDQQILTEILALLEPVRRVTCDFSGLRAA